MMKAVYHTSRIFGFHVGRPSLLDSVYSLHNSENNDWLEETKFLSKILSKDILIYIIIVGLKWV